MSSTQKKSSVAPVSHGTPLLMWTVPEYHYEEKGPIWKALAIIAVMGMVVYGIIADSYAFSFVIILLAGVYFLTHKKPQKMKVQITDMGIMAGHRFYEFSNVKHFWILFQPGEIETINFRVTKNVVKEITILLGDQDPAELREVLSRFIPELAGREETFIEWVIRKLKL